MNNNNDKDYDMNDSKEDITIPTVLYDNGSLHEDVSDPEMPVQQAFQHPAPLQRRFSSVGVPLYKDKKECF